MRIIINIEDGIPHFSAVVAVKKVIEQGFVSKNETQYCWLTSFFDGTTVWADKTKAGSFTFRVFKEKSE